jgi:hypothetical protein
MNTLLIFVFGAVVMGLAIITMIFLMAKQQEFVNSLKPGDPVSFNGCEGKFLGYSGGKLLVELEVPEMMISKPLLKGGEVK